MRARNIKPSFFKNDELVECSFLARLYFIGLWCYADREGRCEYRPKKIKAELFPYEIVDIEKLTQELANHNFLTTYSVNGSNYLKIFNFVKHQRPHIREAKSEIPDETQPRQCPVTTKVVPDHSQDALNEECGMRNEERGIPEKDPPKKPHGKFDIQKVGKYSFAIFDADMAHLLRKLITDNYPNHKQEGKAILQKWANECRLMRTGKKVQRSPEDIERVLRWSQKDSFWMINIQSIGALRDKFERLDLASQKKTNSSGFQPQIIGKGGKYDNIKMNVLTADKKGE